MLAIEGRVVCPACGISTDDDPGAIDIGVVLETHPGPGAPPAGHVPSGRISTIYLLRMTCDCGWSIAGWVEEGGFVGDPSTEVYPETPRTTEPV